MRAFRRRFGTGLILQSRLHHKSQKPAQSFEARLQRILDICAYLGEGPVKVLQGIVDSLETISHRRLLCLESVNIMAILQTDTPVTLPATHMVAKQKYSGGSVMVCTLAIRVAVRAVMRMKRLFTQPSSTLILPPDWWALHDGGVDLTA